MRIERIDVAKYRLPLARRFKAGPINVDQREGRLLRVRSDEGRTGYGEIAPLPGLHAETLADVDAILEVVAPELEGRQFERFGDVANNAANRIAACAPRGDFGAPSAVFGLQCAAASIFAQMEGVPPASILSKKPRAKIAINGLFVGTVTDAAEALAAGTLDAYPCVKVKVGVQSAAADRELLDVLLSALDESVLLRIDANRQLTLDDAIERFRGLPPERIDYLEEPLARPEQLADLHAATGLMMGLDETLLIPALAPLRRARHIAAWCLKPARIGHWKRMLFLSEEAKSHGAVTVVSSCLESGLGLGWQAQMAAALPGEVAACGLGTESWLRVDLVAPRYDSSAGYVRTQDWSGTPSAAVLGKLRFKRAG